MASQDASPLPPGHPTEGYMLNHCMLRIKNPAKSLHFYVDLMGMRPIFIRDVGPMTVHYLGYPDTPEHRMDPIRYADETNPVLGSTKGLLELVHMHGFERSDQTYHSGSEAPYLGFGHVGFTVPDVTAAVERLQREGVEVIKEVGDGTKKGAGITEFEVNRGIATEELSPKFASILSKIAFVRDPDGYFVEIVPRYIHGGPPTNESGSTSVTGNDVTSSNDHGTASPNGQ